MGHSRGLGSNKSGAQPLPCTHDLCRTSALLLKLDLSSESAGCLPIVVES